MSATAGRGVAELPVEYVRTHVRLGYAATEHGYQCDTVTVGLELASAATTCRGLYSGATRGTDDNRILVVTETADLGEARDVLEGVLAADRADVPAITQRRELARLDRPPHAARTVPHCEVPAWFDDLRSTVRHELTQAEREHARAEAERVDYVARLAEAKQQLADAERRLDPHRPALAAAHAEVEAARGRWYTANIEARQATRWQRRGAERECTAARDDLDEAQRRKDAVEAVAEPASSAVADAAATVRDAQRSISAANVLDRWTSPAHRVDELRVLAAALDDWHNWANGRQLPAERIAQLTAPLTNVAAIAHPRCALLAAAVEPWARTHAIAIAPVHPDLPVPTIEIEL